MGPCNAWDNELFDETAVEPDLNPLDDTLAFMSSEQADGTASLESIGDYDLIELIARGGMGVVYKARHRKLNRVVALKMILTGGSANDQESARFEAEVRAVARLRHPNIEQLFEFGRHDGAAFFTMELIDGGSLAEHLREGPMSPHAAAELVEALARGIDHAHRNGIVHRDLKPANVLLDAQDGPKITDFGLARHLTDSADGLTASGALLGTPAYMAPEQARSANTEVGPATDVWALGVILYESLTGIPPFRGVTPLETIGHVVNDEPTRPGRIRSRLSVDLETVCLKCLEKDPRRRYASAQELADELRRHLDGKAVRARPIGAWGRSWRWAWRNPVVASLSMLILLTSVTFGVVTTILAIQARQSAGEARGAQSAAEAAAQAERDAREVAELHEREANWNLYVSRLFPMTQAWQDRNFGDLGNYLKEWKPSAGEPDFRGWEWRYFAAQTEQAGAPLPGVSGQSGLGDWCPISGHIAVSSGHDVLIWDPSSRRVVRRLPLSASWIHRLAWSGDGRHLACGERDRVHIWDAVTGTEVAVLTRDGLSISTMAWSVDSTQLAVAEWDGPVIVWEAKTGRQVSTLEPSRPNRFYTTALSWHPDGERLTAGHRQGFIGEWNLDTGEHRILSDRMTRDSKPLPAIAWNHDGTRLAVGASPNIAILDERGELLASLPGHPHGEVSCLRWASEGKRLLSGGTDRIVHLWNVASAVPVLTLSLHRDPILTVGFSPDGRQLLSGSNTTSLISSASGPIPRADSWRVGQHPVEGVTWSPDGKRIALAMRGSNVVIRESRQGTELATLRQPLPEATSDQTVLWSPDGQHMLTLSSQGQVTVWDAADNKVIRTFTLPSAQGWLDARWSPDGQRVAFRARNMSLVLSADDWTSEVFRTTQNDSSALCWSPDGKQLATVGIRLALWDASSGNLDWELLNHRNTAVAWSPDGRIIVVGGKSGDLAFVDAKTKKQVRIGHGGHQGRVNQIGFSPDGRRIATAGQDATVRIWDAATGRELLVLPGDDTEVRSLAWSPNGSELAVGTFGHRLIIWRAGVSGAHEPKPGTEAEASDVPSVAASGQFAGHRGTVRDLNFSPDGRLAVSASGWPQSDATVRLWNVATGEEIDQFEGHIGHVQAARFSPDGRRILSAGFDGSVRIWDIETRKELHRFAGHTSPIESGGFFPDGERVITVALDRTIRIWNLKTGREDATWEAPEHLLSVAVSPDGSLVAVGGRRGLIMVRNSNGDQVTRQLVGMEGNVESLAFSPDGRSLVCCGDEGSVLLWELPTGRLVRPFRGHRGRVANVKFSPDGRFLATAGQDQTVRLWETGSGRELCQFKGHTMFAWAVAFSPDGGWLLSGGGQATEEQVGSDWLIRKWRIPEQFRTENEPPRMPKLGEGDEREP